MKKVFIVSRGEYSDYCICAVFTDKNLAEAFINSFSKISWYASFNEIEEYELNPHENYLKDGWRTYALQMDIKGNVNKIWLPYYFHSDIGLDIGFDITKEFMQVRCFAKDEKHAIKIANEKRVQFIANNSWGEKPPLFRYI